MMTSTPTIISTPSPCRKAALILLSSLVSLASNKAQTSPPTIAYTSPSYGAIGTQVMIKGKNFGFTQGTSKVTFHGTLSAPLIWNDDWILALVPEGATTGLVQVTVNGMVSNGGYGVTSFIVDSDDFLIQKIKARDVAAIREAGESGNQLFVPYLKQVLATRISKGDDDFNSPWVAEIALAKLGRVPQLQKFWCSAIADDPERKVFPSVGVLESIGGWFAIQGLQKFLTPDDLFLWLKTAGQENASDVARSTLQLRALAALPKVVPNPPPSPTPSEQLRAQWRPSEEQIRVWQDWIAAHQNELSKLSPTGEGVDFSPAACKKVLSASVVGPHAGASRRRSNGKPDELTLERNGGYPSGFWYTVTVRKDGSVIWHGKASVRVKGTVQSRIPLASAANLFDFAHEMNFFSAREVPDPVCVADGGELSVTLREGTRERQISSYCRTTEGLGKLADQIDASTRTLRWIFIDGPTLNSLIAAGSFHIAKDGGPFMEGAIEWDRGDVVRILVKHGFGANPRKRDLDGYLMDAVLRNRPAAAKALLEAGADFTVRSGKLQETPAINAGYRGATMVKLFLDRHAAVNDADSNGNTMLMTAASQGHLDAVQLIVEAGADLNARNARGQTAIDVAEEYREKYYPGLSKQLNAVIDYLQQHGGLR